MKIMKNKIKGSYLITLNQFKDKRGLFMRLFDKKIFKNFKISSNIVQTNYSFTKKKGSIRGFHYQKYPFKEMKAVTCLKGKIYDVILDLRKNSKTYKKWQSFNLDDKNKQILIVPEGCAHAFQSLKDNVEIMYFCSKSYNPQKEAGVRWNDKKFNIKWPLKLSGISDKDKFWKDYNG